MSAEVLRIRARIPGVAEAGDIIVYDPMHPNEALRLCRLVPLAPDLLPVIRAHIGGDQGRPDHPYLKVLN